MSSLVVPVVCHTAVPLHSGDALQLGEHHELGLWEMAMPGPYVAADHEWRAEITSLYLTKQWRAKLVPSAAKTIPR